MTPQGPFSRFFAHEAAGGILLILAALAAMIFANSALGAAYQHLFEVKLTVKIGDIGLSKALILWINDGLMAVFFFLIGLELKKELLEGKLRNPRDVVLPGMAALGGMVVPALIYALLNWSNPATLPGWAIPAAQARVFQRLDDALVVVVTMGSICKLGSQFVAAVGAVGGVVGVANFGRAHSQKQFWNSFFSKLGCYKINSWSRPYLLGFSRF